MSNKNLLLFLAFLCLFPFATILCQPANATFTFTLPSTAITSAGVYNADSTLIRTLWSGVRYISGTYIEKWDGLLDNRTLAPNNGNYYVKVLSSNVQYSWDGARIGNSSTALMGSSIHRAFKEPYCISITGDNLYYGTGYHERFNSQYVVDLNNIGARTRIIAGDGGTNQVTTTNCTDGTFVYWGGQLAEINTKFLFATRVNNNSVVTFSAGQNVTAVTGRTYSGISVSSSDDSYINSIAVQKNGIYLFVARSGLNQLQVLNKTTGAFVRNITLNSIAYLAVDGEDKLWASHGNTVEKYTVNTDGTITTLGIMLTGITQPAAIAVSPDNNTVVVADADLNQQVVKGFSNSSGGAATWTLGTLGGYLNNATVTDYKFAFQYVSIAFQSDGSFWINDMGNCRIQHYSAARVYVNNIAYLSNFYEVHVDENNKNRLYNSVSDKFVEYELNYTKSLDNGQNGSWKLVNNWHTELPGYDLPYGVSRTISFAGKTFTILLYRSANNPDRYHVFELVPGGQLRKTKVVFTDNNTKIIGSGQRIERGGGSPSQPLYYFIYNFTGFDTDNDPVWSSAPVQSINSPLTTQNDALGGSFEKVGNTIFSFQTNAITNNDDSATPDYHLTAFNTNNSKRLFNASPGTSRVYSGDFPPKGEFDNGNGVQVPHAGAYIDVSGNNILWTYRGEFWKQIEANYFNHYHASGLFVGQFGRDKMSNDIELDPPGNEGNMFSGSWVQDTPDRAFVFSGGEGVFAGIHRWRIEGLNSIQIQVCNFNPSLNYVPPPSNLNLMAGLAHGAFVTNNFEWVISHPNTSYTPFQSSWLVQAGKKTPSKYGPQDVSAVYFQEGGTDKIRTVTRSLGANSGLTTWKLTGKISFDDCHISNTGGRGGACYFEIIDATGKTISRFNEEENSRHSGNSFVRGNNVDLHTYSNPSERQVDASRTQPFAISNNNGTLTFQYASYAAITIQVAETGADVTKPASIRLRFTPGDYQKTISVAELSFLKDTTNHYRTQGDGDWGDLDTWESSSDSITWNDATELPNSVANSITIRTGDTVAITAAAAVDQMTIQNGAAVNVAPKASLWINNGVGDDIKIVGTGKLTIQSDSSGTGRIGNSTGNINGNVIVENFINSKSKKAYRLLSPSVNTAGGPEPYIRDNWQEGQNNMSVLSNSNAVPRYGTHITGSLLGANGFDATASATPSLFIYNQTAATQVFSPIANTNATNLEAKKGYLLYVRGDRSIDLQTNLLTSNTTLRATGTVLIGTQTYTGQEGNGRLSLIGNPYASPINWNTVSTDITTNNANFENYCTYWDPNIGVNGGYVNISVNGTKSTADNGAIEIPAGQAFFIKAKAGITAPTFTIKESHKSSPDDMSASRTEAQAQFATSLYYSTLLGRRVMADAVNAVFDANLSAGVDGNDAEEIPNDDENIALARGGKMLGIEARPLINVVDTLFLRTQRLKVQIYEWQFQPFAFARPNLKAYLDDRFLNTRTEINCTDSSITVIPFIVTVVPGSNAADRFRVVFTTNTSLPVTLLSLKASQKGTGVEVSWTTGNDDYTERYEVEKSGDARVFTKAGSVLPSASGGPSNTYSLYDPQPKEGNNYYRIKTFHKNGTIAYSAIVNVKIGGKKTGFEVYPNPVSGNAITIQFNNVSRGAYSASLINAVGQKVFSRTFNHSGGSASQSITLADNLPLGTYFLQVIGNGTTYNKKIIR